jgi:hypothetical protein
MEPIIANNRDRRAWAWLVGQVGEERALAVELPGGRKPYVSNIVRALGLAIPDAVTYAPTDVGRARLRELKAMLQTNRGDECHQPGRATSIRMDASCSVPSDKTPRRSTE